MLLSISGAGGINFTHITNGSSHDSSTVTIPATAQAGDLAVLFDGAVKYGFSGDIPSTVVPSGWTSIKNITMGTNDFHAVRSIGSCRVLTAGEPGSSIVGMNSDYENKMVAIFRPDRTITTVTPSTWEGQITNGNPSSQSIAPSSETATVIVLSFACNYASTPTFSTASPAFDAEASLSDNNIRFGYAIYDAGTPPQNHTVDIGDAGAANILMSGYLTIT